MKDSEFRIWMGYCKYHTVSFNSYAGECEDACHCKDNIPQGSSWGKCKEELCPALRSIRSKGADIDGER